MYSLLYINPEIARLRKSQGEAGKNGDLVNSQSECLGAQFPLELAVWSYTFASRILTPDLDNSKR